MLYQKDDDHDFDALEALYHDAFPDEDLFPLVRDLLSVDYGVQAYAAVESGRYIGHMLLSPCRVGKEQKIFLLGPLGVLPDFQGRGVGSGLVRFGIEAMADQGARLVLVLGDPDYYSRFGFAREGDVAPPYAIPAEWAEAWQSLVPGAGKRGLPGKLSVVKPWQAEALWLP